MNHTVLETIDVLEKAIREVRAGRTIGVALISSTVGGGISCTIAGSANVSDLYLGAAMAQSQLVQMLQSKPVPIPKPDVIEQKIGSQQ